MNSNHSNSSLTLSEKILFFCLLLIPFGTAAHNFATALFVLVASVSIIYRQKKSPFVLSRPEFLPLLAAALLLTWNLFVSELNPHNQFDQHVAFVAGYAPFFLMPYLCRLSAIDGRRVFARFEKILPAFMALWFLVCVTQSMWGWSLIRELGQWQNLRPHGFYSHPLSLAYIILLFWPYSLWRLVGNWRSGLNWLLATSNFGIMFLTNSRTCLAVAVLAVFWVIARSLRGRHLMIAGILLVISGAGISLTDNPVSRKMTLTLKSQDPDRFSKYPDDRLAFWHAHIKMIEQRPIIGHGAHLNTEYRSPYYLQLGLADFKKKYSAHNQFIQILANGGVVGLLLFSSIFASLYYLIWRHCQDPFHQAWLSMTLTLLLSASLTQNALDDAIVRYGLTMIVCWLYLLLPAKPGNHKPSPN